MFIKLESLHHKEYIGLTSTTLKRKIKSFAYDCKHRPLEIKGRHRICISFLNTLKIVQRPLISEDVCGLYVTMKLDK